MTELRIQIDPCNPGQFYACCGLIQLFDLARAETLSRFELNRQRPRIAEFIIQSSIRVHIAELANAVRQAVYRQLPSFGLEDGDKISAISLTIFDREFTLDWWLDEFHKESTPLKMWAANQSSINNIRVLVDLFPLELPDDAFQACGMTTTRFSVDPRPSWLGLALHLGYATNERSRVSEKQALSYPLIEIFAAFGLQAHRPLYRGGRQYQYGMWQEDLPYPVTALAAREAWEGMKYSRFDFSIENRDNSGRFKTFSFARWNE